MASKKNQPRFPAQPKKKNLNSPATCTKPTERLRFLACRCDADLHKAVMLAGGSEWMRRVLTAALEAGVR